MTYNTLAIIPAKTDSTRLPKKNLQKINDTTLIEHSINYAKMCLHNSDIVVSTESDEVAEIAHKAGVQVWSRSLDLCGDSEVVDVYLDVIQNGNFDDYDYVVGLQPDHPDREHSLTYCLDYMVKNNYDDLITIEPNYKRSGSVRIFKYSHLIAGNVSKRLGCIKDDATDIHYADDLNRARERMKND
jgi:CMP-N-acetylneuraminic acid synthetase